MIRDNTRFGYYCSIALHTTIVVGAILWVVVKSIFPEEQHEPIDPFEIVEPPAPPISAPQPQPEPEPKIEQPPETKPLDKIELPPEPEPEPEPTPPEPEPKPELTPPEPEPKPSPKPKKVEKPKPAPKKVSFQDFVKRNPKVNKKTTTRTKTRSAPKIANISATTTNISNIKSDVVGTSTAMQDVLSAYYSEIRRIAKSNWAIPPTAQMTDWVVVAFRVSKNGDVSGVKVQSSSGTAELEKSALSTMRSVSLPPPPDNKPHTLSIKFDLK
ncbi:MAG: TonB family protein [Opitutales bacterium]|nr:TonB family protein [Opitutales bacterium]